MREREKSKGARERSQIVRLSATRISSVVPHGSWLRKAQKMPCPVEKKSMFSCMHFLKPRVEQSENNIYEELVGWFQKKKTLRFLFLDNWRIPGFPPIREVSRKNPLCTTPLNRDIFGWTKCVVFAIKSVDFASPKLSRSRGLFSGHLPNWGTTGNSLAVHKKNPFPTTPLHRSGKKTLFFFLVT